MSLVQFFREIFLGKSIVLMNLSGGTVAGLP